MRYKIVMVKKVPVITIDGIPHFVDTGHPAVTQSVHPGVAGFFGIQNLRMVGYGWLKRYTLIDYSNMVLETSDKPIAFENGATASFSTGMGGLPRVEMEVDGVKSNPYIDTGAAYSYMHDLNRRHPKVGIAEENDHTGKSWSAPVYQVPCRFDGHPFEIVCGDARDNKSMVPVEGVVGYDFFNSFTVVIDKVGGKLIFRPVEVE